MSAPTVRVRIAVAVTPDGEWSAAGHTTQDYSSGVEGPVYCSDEDASYRARDYHGDPDAIVHFVEADVPLPAPVTVEGEVRGE